MLRSCLRYVEEVKATLIGSKSSLSFFDSRISGNEALFSQFYGNRRHYVLKRIVDNYVCMKVNSYDG